MCPSEIDSSVYFRMLRRENIVLMNSSPILNQTDKSGVPSKVFETLNHYRILSAPDWQLTLDQIAMNAPTFSLLYGMGSVMFC